MQDLFWLLLPVAAASGWLAARRSCREQRRSCFDVGSDYFKGLNFLLNEQPDKAIEVFERMTEVDNDTAEIHLALGSLFRRRGEVDRAIRIHQNLVERSNLSIEQRTHAVFELGEDYMKAGLLDRAEQLFHELITVKQKLPDALEQLIDIYQQERDWQKAIETCSQYDHETGCNSGDVIAHYYCEMAEEALKNSDQPLFSRYIKQAFEHDPDCVRASLLIASKEKDDGNYEAAIAYYKQVVEQDIDYIPKIIASLQNCFRQIGRDKEMSAELDTILERYDGITPVLYRAEELLCDNEQLAVDYMVEQLRQKPSVRGLQWLVGLNLEHSEGKARENLIILQELIRALLDNKPVYECQHCGFSGKSMHWQCPGCKHWNSVKPIKGVAAE